jgi:hypothetical protein
MIPGYWILDTGYWLQVTGYRLQVTWVVARLGTFGYIVSGPLKDFFSLTFLYQNFTLCIKVL